jgi:predicted alpha/beta hydrolase family esterase
VQQPNWESPRRIDWVAGLQQALETLRTPVILVAHSLGCVTVAHWVLQARSAERMRANVRGALLVAPADVERPDAPQPLREFAPLPRVRLPFPSLVVAGRNDPYCCFERAANFARDWGAGLLSIGDAGHINTASGHRRWTEGLELLQSFGE